jgi:hypothetical protein
MVNRSSRWMADGGSVFGWRLATVAAGDTHHTVPRYAPACPGTGVPCPGAPRRATEKIFGGQNKWARPLSRIFLLLPIFSLKFFIKLKSLASFFLLEFIR